MALFNLIIFCRRLTFPLLFRQYCVAKKKLINLNVFAMFYLDNMTSFIFFLVGFDTHTTMDHAPIADGKWQIRAHPHII